MTRFHKALVALCIITVLCAVGESDYNDAKREHAHYCAMVAAGHWPDFKKLVEKGECDDEQG